ncbi:MAG TPA: PKD domain-containing protein [Solirubrobacteraceae bacterium]|nr:PKD domain-containing protein [Solirubrobacteraceae bacterium]
MSRLGALAGVAAIVLALAAPGGASAKGVGDLTPDLPTGAHLHRAVMAHAAALQYQGGPVLHSNRTHLIFWQPSGSGLAFDPGYEQLIEQFLTQVAADSHRPTNVYGLSGQYTDSSGPAAYASSYAGAVIDTDPLPANQCAEPSTGPSGWAVCLTDAQLQSEIEQVVSTNAMPRGATDIYILVLPNGFGNCTDSSSSSCALGGTTSGYCGYHSQTEQSGLLYMVIPYNAVPGHCQSGNPRPNKSTADPAISTISHEHNETITDPQTYNSWIDPNGNEEGDLCITAFGPAIGGSGAAAYNEIIGGGHYYLQEEWSNEDSSCQARDENDWVFFTTPARVNAGRAVAFGAHGNDRDGRIVGYLWSFGDGTGSRRRQLTHVFARPGIYRIQLRLTDSAANWATITRTLKVVPAAAREPRHPVRVAAKRRR